MSATRRHLFAPSPAYFLRLSSAIVSLSRNRDKIVVYYSSCLPFALHSPTSAAHPCYRYSLTDGNHVFCPFLNRSWVGEWYEKEELIDGQLAYHGVPTDEQVRAKSPPCQHGASLVLFRMNVCSQRRLARCTSDIYIHRLRWRAACAATAGGSSCAGEAFPHAGCRACTVCTAWHAAPQAAHGCSSQSSLALPAGRCPWYLRCW